MLFFEPSKHPVLGIDLLTVDLPGQIRPHPLMLRLGPALLGLVPHDLINDLVGSTNERRDTVNRSDYRHSLLVGLLPSVEPALGSWLVFVAAHHHPLTVGRHDQ